ncbi:BlaI/MecI/CopY family transcriptional regulator [Streptomyces sp. OfavH-34-F]|uniref:BlaI/MecI/CopY family transcriptional regulator n=1 Tax=unclassified Streptomyces TaxID=2593676 RepID=UPI001EF2AA31|nr:MULTISPECIES: BlaI/MecI/CopY family transcriptional regulator [unclassified Streptomyces]MCG7522919.1 BlaI/MecI/CopY family transcriptional regulator [Streptomyces sp. OfavH-34-F]MCX5417973.1 BlaI/MecI/CopY family transcriptional regulator [Streptomyces sp. NBC_00059]
MGAQEQAPGAGGGRRANGALENEVLALLHTAGRALTPGEVAERLSNGPAHTTVATTLGRLHTRGVLERTPAGRSYAYTPVTDESGLTARHMRQVMESGSDRASVLTRFVDELSDDDEDLLRRLLGTDE